MNSALSYLKRQRRRIEDQQALEGRSQTFSLARYQLHTQLTRVIDSHAYGICLDIGSGHAPFKQKLATIASRVICMDVEDRIGRTDIIADVQNMPDMEDASIDTVLCSQVLEHVPRPWDALSEIHRVLKQGGKAILSVPHLSSIHEAPHDYFRYTEFGLASMLRAQGFEILELHRAGGLVSFLGHYVMLVGLSLLASIPVVLRVSQWINYSVMVRALAAVDYFVGLRSVFPCNYVVVAAKTQKTDYRELRTGDSGPPRRPAVDD